MKLTALVSALVLSAANAAAPAAEPTFTAKPSVTRDGELVKIAFAVSAPTDVEVAVLAADGAVVRHLAAGVLGAANPPPQPLKAGLAQELVWDGNDDFARPAGKGPFRVRVRAGLQLKLGALLADDPLYVCYPLALSTDDGGNLYFLSSSAAGGLDFQHLRVFNRKGQYLRTVMPMPADLPLEKAKGFDAVELGAGRWAPRNRCATWPDFYRKEAFATGVSFQLANRVAKDGVLNLCNNGSILRLNADGSPADATTQPVPIIPGRKIYQWSPLAGYFYVAISPDGSRTYLSGLGGAKDNSTLPAGRILVFDGKETRTFADVKLGEKQKRADWIPRVNYIDLAGMSCDAQGNLFVCDPTSGKVRVFDPNGKETGDFAVDDPLRVACHRKTGEIYVLCVTPAYTRGKKTLRKFSPLKDGPRELASFALPDTGEDACMALDDSADPPVVWAATRAGHVQFTFGAPARVFRLEDKGASFAESAHPITFDLDGVKERLAVHPGTELVIYKGQYTEAGAVNGLTGEKVALPFKKCIDMAAGQDGNWYLNTTGSFAGYVCKYDKDLKPVPLTSQVPPENPNTKVPPNAVGWAYGKYGWGISATGLAADPAGRLFVHQLGNVHVNGGYFVIVFGPDGKAEDHPWARDNPSFKEHKFFNSALVALNTNQGNGLQLDTQGNVYVGAILVPIDHKAPPAYEKDPAYAAAVGSIIKFPKDGGQCTDIAATPPADRKGLVLKREIWPRTKVFAENATAVYPGLGCMAGAIGSGCSCRKPMFHVDPYGRLAIPNAITFKVRFVDNAGNDILEVGKYGNIDSIVAPLKAVQESLPKDDPLRKLEISAARPADINALLKARPLPASDAFFAWPLAVAVSERAVYVADVYNHHIVRLDKTCAAEETAEVK